MIKKLHVYFGGFKSVDEMVRLYELPDRNGKRQSHRRPRTTRLTKYGELRARQNSVRGGGRSARFEKNLNLSIIGLTRTLKYKALTINKKNFLGPTNVGAVGPAPPTVKYVNR